MMLNRYRRVARTVVVGIAIVGWSDTTAGEQDVSAAQVISRPLDMPAGPAAAGFDVKRLNTDNYGAFEPFYVSNTPLLQKALDEGKLAPDSRLLVTRTAGGRVALLTDQMAYHHLAQGRDGGKDWMATF
jgi:hypothetical protein